MKGSNVVKSIHEQSMVVKDTTNNKPTTPLIIVGLGNSGRRYTFNKHNIGLLALKDLAANHYDVTFQESKPLGGHVARVRGQSLVLYWPEAQMNECGEFI